MKNIIIIGLFVMVSACTKPPSDRAIQTAIAFTQYAQTAFIPHTSLPPTKTTEPPKTPSAIPTVTATPTNLPIPSLTQLPTEELQFFSIFDCIPRNTLVQKGSVVKVGDGDDFTVQLLDGTTHEVRYIGINTPENDRPFFTDAVNANASLINQKEVTLVKDSSEDDQFGRLLRYVFVGDVFVNLELIKMGFARAASYPPDTACDLIFASAEDESRAAQIGMWAATQTPEPAAPQVVIIDVNKREEWVEIHNNGDSDVDLSGWNLVSERGNQECYLAGIIRAGTSLRIWSGTAQGSDYSCGYSNPIWNNSEPDPAVLYNHQGVEVSRK